MRELHERRSGGEPLGGHRRVDAGVPGVRRRRAAEPVRVADDLPDRAKPIDSFNKIAHMTGIGRRALRMVATDRDLKMDLADLARRVAEDRRNGFAPVMVVGTAGTTAAGAIDPLPDLARFCRSEELWFHVDAAWGGAAILSPRLRGHLAGIDARRLDHVRRAQMVLGADGRRDVLLPASRRGRRGVPRADLLHAGKDGRAGRRSLHHVGAVVAPVHRLEAVSCARAARRIRVRRDDRAPGAHGRRAAGVARARGMAHRQPHAAAAGVLHAGWPRHQQIPRRPLRAPDRLDVGSPAGRRRAGRAGVRHKFPDERVRHRVGRARDEPARRCTSPRSRREERDDRHPRRLRGRSDDEGRGRADLSDRRLRVRQRRPWSGAVQSRGRGISLHPHQQPDDGGAGAARRRARGRSRRAVRELGPGGGPLCDAQPHRAGQQHRFGSAALRHHPHAVRAPSAQSGRHRPLRRRRIARARSRS